jgi:glycine/D-amino acid oxidase-like deaminating enzyme
MQSNVDVVIIGGGFYGCAIALELKKLFPKVVILEKEADLLQRASRFNQARVHKGYHYPRNLVTAYRSAQNYPRFVEQFSPAIEQNFTSIYAIPRQFSQVSAQQFYRIYKELQIPIDVASPEIKTFFNPYLIEEVFITQEAVFNSEILKEIIKKELEKAGVMIFYNQEVDRVSALSPGNLQVSTMSGDVFNAQYVFNCSYSQINTLLHRSHLPPLDFKHEITEISLIQVPTPLKDKAITIMDGLFFSLMPFPSRNAHSLSHVRYTPHQSWSDKEEIVETQKIFQQSQRNSHFPYMLKDAQRYVPHLEKAKYLDSFYEVKTVLTQNEIDDGRPILFKQDYGLKNFFVIMGGKIDNVYDVIERLKEAFV